MRVLQWQLLDTGPVPGSSKTMELHQSPNELAIRVDGRELMSSRMHGSEDALADLGCAPVEGRADVRVLVGGLGMGFTLAAALRRVGPEGRVVVAELVPAIVRWNRGLLGHVAGHPLADPRASIHEGDVGEAIRAAPDAWDAILLDVDNGPKGLTRPSNDWLYGWHGLAAAHAALRPGGVLAVWSAAPDVAFTRRMQRADFEVEVVPVRARGEKGGRQHVVWVGRRG